MNAPNLPPYCAGRHDDDRGTAQSAGLQAAAFSHSIADAASVDLNLRALLSARAPPIS